MLPEFNNDHRIEDNIQSDKLRLLFHQSYQAVFFSLIAAFIYAGIVWNHIDHRPLMVWMVIIFISGLFRLYLFHSYTNSAPHDTQILKWEKPYYFTLNVSSLTWGLGTVLITYNEPMQYQYISFYFLMGMAGAALAVYSSIRYFAITTIFNVLGPSLIWLLIQGTTTSLLIASATSLFLISAIRATKILESTLHKTFQLSNELNLAKNNAERLARTDALTDLNNRRAFSELVNNRIQYCERHHHPYSLLVLDLDHFKTINDQYGHDSGDIALQQLAKVLKQSIRSSDICGRIGGEEFALLLSHTEPEETLKVAEKIRTNIENIVIKTDDSSFSITSSIGIAYGPDPLKTLLKKADKAMYQAKQAGRNKVVIHDSQESPPSPLSPSHDSLH